tara:strand:+ start:47 stop:298 length:252 start_codon:yes stop_codon:yes gene_type:complete
MACIAKIGQRVRMATKPVMMETRQTRMRARQTAVSLSVVIIISFKPKRLATMETSSMEMVASETAPCHRIIRCSLQAMAIRVL